MAFIRIKEIGKTKKYQYAYVVENRWKKRGSKGSRQKVSQYLGKVIKLEPSTEISLPSVSYTHLKKGQIIKELIRDELMRNGFSQNGSLMTQNDIIFDLSRSKFVNTEGIAQNMVLELNEGFLCSYTIRKLQTFRKLPDEYERECAVRLASCFLECGLKIDQELFVSYFDKI